MNGQRVHVLASQSSHIKWLFFNNKQKQYTKLTKKLNTKLKHNNVRCLEKYTIYTFSLIHSCSRFRKIQHRFPARKTQLQWFRSPHPLHIRFQYITARTNLREYKTGSMLTVSRLCNIILVWFVRLIDMENRWHKSKEENGRRTLPHDIEFALALCVRARGVIVSPVVAIACVDDAPHLCFVKFVCNFIVD